MNVNPASPVVVKVGGSLYDLPDLGSRLRRWLASLHTPEVVLVPGGGSAADLMRDLDRRHGLGEEAAHWVALGALTLNALFLVALLGKERSLVTKHPKWCRTAWRLGMIPIIDCYSFARADEGSTDFLPHRWTTASDCLAARIAAISQARRLILLKSITIPEDMDWTEAGQHGFVDSYFAQAVSGFGNSACEVTAVNFREWRP